MSTTKGKTHKAPRTIGEIGKERHALGEAYDALPIKRKHDTSMVDRESAKLQRESKDALRKVALAELPADAVVPSPSHTPNKRRPKI